MTQSIQEPARAVPVIGRAEVVVVGGGPSGIAAATAAARAGAATILVERYGFLGGTGTAAGVTSFCGLHANVHGEVALVVCGIAGEILDRLKQLDALNTPHSIFGRTVAQSYDNAGYKLVADELVLGAGAEVVFHAIAVGVVMDAGRVRGLLVETKSGRGAILADVFIDCSGDGDLCAWAGAPFEKGDGAGNFAYPTLMFRIGHVDGTRALAEGKPNLRALMESAGGDRFPRRSAYINPQLHAGEWRANVTQIARRDGKAIDATDHRELSFAEIEGRRQALDFFRFLRASVPGFEASYLLELAPQIGIRESRRVMGEYVLTEHDVVELRDFRDAIGVDAWPLENHVRRDVVWQFLEGRGYCQLPYRMMLPRQVTNLLVAGRCASATHGAQSSVRVSGPCFAMGQAAGTAAAISVRSHVAVKDIDIGTLQQRLRDSGAFLGEAQTHAEPSTVSR
jgi:FAD-dependent oxidoreductase family protein